MLNASPHEGLAFLFLTKQHHLLTKDTCYKAGFIMRPHGLAGEVTIALDADSPADWEDAESVLVEVKGRLVPYFIESISLRGDKAFLKLEDVDTVEQAGKLKGCALFFPKDSRPELPPEDFYNDEVIGYAVQDQALGTLGTVEDIEQAGPNRFLIIHYQEKEVMIPTQPPLLVQINRNNKTILVQLPEGFLDI